MYFYQIAISTLAYVFRKISYSYYWEYTRTQNAYWLRIFSSVRNWWNKIRVFSRIKIIYIVLTVILKQRWCQNASSPVFVDATCSFGLWTVCHENGHVFVSGDVLGLFILNISIFGKNVLFNFQADHRKRETAQLASNKWTPFCKIVATVQ